MIADPQLVDRLKLAVAELIATNGAPSSDMDQKVAQKWRTWLGEDLPWAGTGVSDHEFFFLSTLCGTMTIV